MPVKSVGFAIGNLRARENRMLKKSDMLRLAAASNTEELAAALSDSGIDGKDGAEIPELLSAETEKLWKYLTDNAPDMSLFEPFIYENDFHNFKAVLKGTVRNRDYKSLLITPASVNVALLERAVKEKRNHVSLAVYSGGNELMEAPDTPCSLENETIAMLWEIVKRHDGRRPFLPTSASGPREFISREKGVSHDVHGSWRYEGAQGYFRALFHAVGFL